MASGEPRVIPKPGIPRTLGILNIIFGVICLLWGGCQVTLVLVAPAVADVADKALKSVETKQKEEHAASVKAAEEREKTATDPAAKKEAADEKARLIASPPKSQQPISMKESFEAFTDPTIKTYTLIQGGSEALANLLLVIAGIGLLRTAPWGLSMSLWLAGLQIVRVLVLAGVNWVYVYPESQKIAERQLAKLEIKANEPGGNPALASSLQWSRAAMKMGPYQMIGIVLAASTYPIITLCLLNTAGAAAACRPARTEGFTDL
jgi:hypothetical protein